MGGIHDSFLVGLGIHVYIAVVSMYIPVTVYYTTLYFFFIQMSVSPIRVYML